MAVVFKKKREMEIDHFITKLGDETGVSDSFLKAVRPSVKKAYLEDTQDERNASLNAVWEAAKRQAETENSLRAVRHASDELKKAENVLVNKLEKLGQKMTDMQQTTASSAFNLLTSSLRAPDPEDVN